MDEHLRFTREDLLTPDDIAYVLRIERRTAVEYMRRGVVPAEKIGRRWYSPKPLLDDYVEELFMAA